MKHKIIKIATILFFMSLITGLIAYKSGYFNNKKEVTEIHNNEMDTNTIDAIDNQYELLPSSKTFIIKEHPTKVKESAIDTVIYDDEFLMMSSSKSGRIIDINTTNKNTNILDNDSIK